MKKLTLIIGIVMLASCSYFEMEDSRDYDEAKNKHFAIDQLEFHEAPAVSKVQIRNESVSVNGAVAGAANNVPPLTAVPLAAPEIN